MMGGAPALDEASLRLVLARLCLIPPVFEPASEAELAVARATFLPAVSAEPDVEPDVEPQIMPTPGAQQAHVAARPLTGRKVRTVVIDAGHGGYDPGARSRRGLKEKDVCLDIALRFRRELMAAAPDLAVVLTRDRDVYLTLRQRTEIANKADAFAAQAGVQIEAARVGIANLDAQIRAKALEWDGYKAKLSAAEIEMRGLMQGNELLIQKYRTEGDLGVAQYGAAIKKWEVQIKDYEAGKQAAIQTAKINGDQAMHAASVRMDAAKVGAQVYAQLTGSAYSIAKVSAGIDHRGSLGVSYSYSNKTSTQPTGITQ
jgi:hypothetical protein